MKTRKWKIVCVGILAILVTLGVFYALFSHSSDFDESEYITLLRADYDALARRAESSKAEVDRLLGRIDNLKQSGAELKRELEDSQREVEILQAEQDRQQKILAEAEISLGESLSTARRIGIRGSGAETGIREALSFIEQLETGNTNSKVGPLSKDADSGR